MLLFLSQSCTTISQSRFFLMCQGFYFHSCLQLRTWGFNENTCYCEIGDLKFWKSKSVMLSEGGCPLKCLCQGLEKGQGLTVFMSCKVAAQCGSTVWHSLGFSGMGWNAKCKQEHNGLGLSESWCGGLQVGWGLQLLLLPGEGSWGSGAVQGWAPMGCMLGITAHTLSSKPDTLEDWGIGGIPYFWWANLLQWQVDKCSVEFHQLVFQRTTLQCKCNVFIL